MIAAIYAPPIRSMFLAGTSAALLAAGCTIATTDVIQARAEGLAQAYAVPTERAWRAARDVLDAVGAQAVEERREESLLLALTTDRAAGFVMPTRIAVWIEPVDGGTRVTVVSRQERGVLARALSEAEFHQALRATTPGRLMMRRARCELAHDQHGPWLPPLWDRERRRSTGGGHA